MKTITIETDYITVDGVKYIPEPKEDKTELVVGKWYKNNDYGYENSLAFSVELSPNSEIHFKGYGFDKYGDWYELTTDYDFGSHNWKEATSQEVSDALEKEAVKRGFIDGAHYQWINCPLRKVYGKEFIYNKGVLRINGFTIMDSDGKWAEIIKTISLKEAEEKLNCKIV